MRISRSIGIGILALLCIGVGLVYYFFFWNPVTGESFDSQYGLVLKDYAGREVPLSEFKNRLLVVHVWASWCTYCGEELRNLARLKDIYGDEIHIIAVNRAEPLRDAEAFSTALGIGDGIAFILDPEDAFYKEIGGYAMPETVFIDDRGEIVYHQRGPMKLPDVIEKMNVMLGKETP